MDQQQNKMVHRDKEFCQNLQNLLTVTIEKSKEQFYSRISTKLMDSTTSAKAYWSILKTILNNKKVPCIPSIYHNKNYFTDFKEKAQTFNDFFAKQCTLVEKSRKLPTNSFNIINNLLSTITFTKDDTAKIIKNLNPNKAHVFDMISICMLKICGDSILKLYNLFSNHALRMRNFPSNGKKLMLYQFIRSNKQLIENYRPILLLPVCSKILERIIYSKMFEFFLKMN